MTTATLGLGLEQVERLRAAHPYPIAASPDVRASGDGWTQVNRRYLGSARAAGAAAMRDLMQEVGIARPSSVCEAADLLELAILVFTPPEGYAGVIERPRGNLILMANVDCPMFRSLEERNWQGITACSSWHTRQGWYDALGVMVSDSVLREKKWGDRACVAELRVEALTSG